MESPLDIITYRQLAEDLKPLTESESALNTFIIEHFEELSYYGIIDLAQKARVSKATIGRYLNKLGYTGYAAFKHALKRNLNTHNLVSPIEANKTKHQCLGNNVKQEALRYIGNVSQLIDQFAAELNLSNLEKLAHLIVDHKRTIYVVGPASSLSLALHFTTLLKYHRSDIVLLPLDNSELPKALLGVKAEDVLIVFSYYRFNAVVLDITKYFDRKNAHVTVVTNAFSNPYSIYSDVQYVLPSDADSIFHSRTIGFLFVEALLFLVQKVSHDHENFEELEELFKFFGTFSSLEFK